MVVLGMLGLIMGLSYFLREKLAGAIRWFLLFLGIFTCVWCTFYGIMCFCENIEAAHVMRNIGLFGITAFLTTEAFLLIHMVEMGELMQNNIVTKLLWDLHKANIE